MPPCRFPKPWTVEPMPSGHRVIDNGIVLAHVYGQPDGAIAVSDSCMTNDEARRISKLIARLPELVELHGPTVRYYAEVPEKAATTEEWLESIRREDAGRSLVTIVAAAVDDEPTH